MIVKLCDLDCARCVGELYAHDDEMQLRATIAYAPPEVYTGYGGQLRASLQSDLFPLGMVLV